MGYGVYQARESFAHRLDLRAKVVFSALFIAGALRRSDALALAIRNRDYGAAGARRTCIRAYRLTRRDRAVLLAGAALLAVVVVL